MARLRTFVRSQSARNGLNIGEETPLIRHSESPTSSWTRLRNQFFPNRQHFAHQMIYESLDYEITESTIEMHERMKTTERDHFRTIILRWIILFFVGMHQNEIGFSYATIVPSPYRFLVKIVQPLHWTTRFDRCIANDCLPRSFFVWVGVDILLVGIAGALVCFAAPIAAGSGIPEVKCYLNGIKMPEVVRLKTLITKSIGVLFSVSGGMTIGKEGPMIHSGSVIAAGLSQGKSTSIPLLDTNLFKQFRNDVEKRDFVSGGAAAGVSAAFGAPIGGVLFSIEEGASFWNQFLTWRIFFCSMTATFVLNILLSSFENHDPDALSNPGLVNFGKFEDMPYNLSELPVFIIMGVLGGLMGAIFNALNEKLTHFRRKHILTPTTKLLEVLAIAILTTVVFFMMILASADCLPLGQSPESSSPLQFFCEEEQYSAMAALLFNTPENSIKNLFHSSQGSYKSSTLIAFSLCYWALSCITYGLSIPSGLFVPSLLTGAAWGRLIGNVLAFFFPNQPWVSPGKYALIGAAANLAGIVRMTISLTVIVIEATGNVTYGLPIMLAVVFAKVTGDIFNEGLYDIHIHIKHIPILPWAPPPVASHLLRAQDFMSREVQCLRLLNRVSDINRLLRNSKHNAFPVIAWEASNHEEVGLAYARGMILRQHLISILKQRAFGDLDPFEHTRLKNNKCLTLDELMKDYPRWPKIDSIIVAKEDENKWIDLRPYMNSSPHLLQYSCAIPALQLVGLVTRKDLANITDDMKQEDFWTERSSRSEIRYFLPENITDDVDTVVVRGRNPSITQEHEDEVMEDIPLISYNNETNTIYS
eukprot:gene9160-1452_t